MDEIPTTPAKRIIDLFGVKRVAAWTRRHTSRVHAWSWPEDQGGTGGVIPHKARLQIMMKAKEELGQELSFADFEPRDGETYLFREDAA